MDIERQDLDWAADEGILSETQADRLWGALKKRRAAPSKADSSWFDLASIAYYGGALIVLIAMVWFLVRGAEALGHGPVTFIALLYGGAFVGAGAYLRTRRNLRVAGGLCLVLAVVMVPVVLYNFEHATGLWEGAYRLTVGLGLLTEPTSYDLLREDLYRQLRQNGLLEEIGTVVAGVLAVRYVRFPFLTAPVALALWAMATITAPRLLAPEPAWEMQLWISVAFGAAMLVGAYLVDRRTEGDYAFWGYLFGLMALWGGLSLMQSGSEWEHLTYGLINAVLVGLGVFLERRAFLGFGALGIFRYLGHLAYEVFANSVYFPLALSLLGVGIIYLGIQYQRHRGAIDRWFWARLPARLRRLSPRRR